MQSAQPIFLFSNADRQVIRMMRLNVKDDQFTVIKPNNIKSFKDLELHYKYETAKRLWQLNESLEGIVKYTNLNPNVICNLNNLSSDFINGSAELRDDYERAVRLFEGNKRGSRVTDLNAGNHDNDDHPNMSRSASCANIRTRSAPIN